MKSLSLCFSILQSIMRKRIFQSPFMEVELHVIDGIPQLFLSVQATQLRRLKQKDLCGHVAHLKPSDGGSASTQLATHLTGIHSAIKMLNNRIRVLHHSLVGMQKGNIPCEISLLSRCKQLEFIICHARSFWVCSMSRLMRFTYLQNVETCEWLTCALRGLENTSHMQTCEMSKRSGWNLKSQKTGIFLFRLLKRVGDSFRKGSLVEKKTKSWALREKEKIGKREEAC